MVILCGTNDHINVYSGVSIFKKLKNCWRRFDLATIQVAFLMQALDHLNLKCGFFNWRIIILKKKVLQFIKIYVY